MYQITIFSGWLPAQHITHTSQIYGPKENYIDRLPALEGYLHLNHALAALKEWDELEGVALVMTFFTRPNEKWGINQNKVNWSQFLILNQPIKINMQSGNIF